MKRAEQGLAEARVVQPAVCFPRRKTARKMQGIDQADSLYLQAQSTEYMRRISPKGNVAIGKFSRVQTSGCFGENNLYNYIVED